MSPRSPRLRAPITQWTLLLAPELAVLAVLDKALLTSAHAIDAAHPLLGDPSEPDSQVTAAARALVGRLHDCRDAVHRYRHHVLVQLALDDPNDDDEDAAF